MCDEEWSAMFKAPLARYVPIFEDEALTPTLLRSFRPWPAALHEALRELGVSEEDVPLITAALCPDSSPKPKTAIATAAASASYEVAATKLAAAFAAIYINLATRPDRRKSVQQSLEAVGLQAERFEALTGAAASASDVCLTWDTTLNAQFDRNTKIQPTLEMSAGERGCAASHLALWRRCAETNGPLLVLEDDLIFASAAVSRVGPAVRSLVAALEAGVDAPERTLLLYLGADAYLRDGAPSLRGQQAIWAARSANVACALKEARWAWQTHAYVIWPAAARVLLAGLPIDAPVDVYLSRHFHERRLCGLVADPEFVRQEDPYHGGDVVHSSLGNRPSWGAMANQRR